MSFNRSKINDSIVSFIIRVESKTSKIVNNLKLLTKNFVVSICSLFCSLTADVRLSQEIVYLLYNENNI